MSGTKLANGSYDREKSKERNENLDAEHSYINLRKTSLNAVEIPTPKLCPFDIE